MPKLSLQNKLILSTLSMFALALLLVGWGVASLRTFQSQFADVSEVTVRKLVLAHEIMAGNSEMISAQRGVILAAFGKDATERLQYEENFRRNEQSVRTAIEQLRPLLQTPEGNAILADLLRNLQAWPSYYRDLIRNAAAGDITEANRIRKEMTAPLYKHIIKDAVRMTEIQMETLAKNKQEIAAQYQKSLWLLYGVLALFAIVGTLVVLFVRTVTRSLRDVIQGLLEGAELVGGAAAEVSSASQFLAQGSSQQAASLEETSAATEQIHSMARRNSEHSECAAELMRHVQTGFGTTGLSLAEMVNAITEITISSNKIANIIKVIDEISFQTNILALNAAVEAARAGAAGMSFAVVADEVRNLAQRCAQAARDTATLIEECISKSRDGKTKVDEVARAIQSIIGQSTKVQALIEGVTANSREQADGLDQVARAVVQISNVTQSTAASAEQSAATSQELNAQTESVRHVVRRLTHMVEGGNEGDLSLVTRAYHPVSAR